MRKVERSYLENFEMRYWRRALRISWTERMPNDDVSEMFEEDEVKIRRWGDKDCGNYWDHYCGKVKQ